MKYYGEIGYSDVVDDGHGVWKERIVEKRNYSGDILKVFRRWKNGESINDDVSVSSNKISIIADPFAYQNFHKMRYIEWMGTKWIISDVEVEYPRLTLTLGGIWNGFEEIEDA